MFSIPYPLQASCSETTLSPQPVVMSLFDPWYNLHNFIFGHVKKHTAGCSLAHWSSRSTVFPWPILFSFLACYVVFIMELPIRQQNRHVLFCYCYHLLWLTLPLQESPGATFQSSFLLYPEAHWQHLWTWRQTDWRLATKCVLNSP